MEKLNDNFNHGRRRKGLDEELTTEADGKERLKRKDGKERGEIREYL